ncbi:hypothetical protein [Pseudoalteromonas rubra]|nr:hypothetical protein [Pseudoalteromonas rubra]
MTNTSKQTYSALKNGFKWIPHRVRDDDGVVGGVAEQGEPGANAEKLLRRHDKYTETNLFNTEKLV